MAALAVPCGLLHVRVSRPRQCRVRENPDAARPGLLGRGLRRRRRHLLSRVRAVRGAQQSAVAEGRCPPDVQPHSRALGHHVGMHAVRAERARLLRDAIPARRLRSGLCAGHDLLPVVLVWTVPDGARHRPGVRGRPTWRDCRRPRVGMAHLEPVRRRRPCRLAMDVPRGRTAVHCARPSTLRVLSDRPADARWLTEDEKLLLDRDTRRASIARIRSRRSEKPASLCARHRVFQHHLPDLRDQFLAPDAAQGSRRERHDPPWLVRRDSLSGGCGQHEPRGPSFRQVGERRYHCAIPALAAAACLIAAVFADGNLTLTLMALTCATACSVDGLHGVLGHPFATRRGNAAAGGIALINTVGLLGRILGAGGVRLDQDVDREHAPGLIVMACVSTTAAILILTGKLTMKKA